MTVPGLTTIASSHDHADTLERFERAVRAKGMTIFARIDHHAGAVAAGLELPPMVVVIFGDPRGGTPLMQLVPAFGLELPLKALVWEDAARQTWLSYDEPAALAVRYGLEAPGIIAAMTKALADLARQATAS
jgi:uncharacterized protein (DUF302 family)